MPIPVPCACGATLRVPDHVAGRNVKCPKCAAAVKVPGAPAASPPKVAAAPAAGKPTPAVAKSMPAAPAATKVPPAKPAPTPAHAQEFAELPALLRDRARAELQKGETVVWAGLPSERLVTLKWWSLIGMGFLFSAGALVIGFVAFVIITLPEVWVGLVLGGFLSLFFFGGPLFGWLAANGERRKFSNRAYVLTNKRCLVVEQPPNAAGEVETFAMPQLQFLFTQNSWLVKGAGDVVLRAETHIVREHTSKGTRSFRQTDHFGFLAVENVKDVEDVVRRTLVEPWLAAEERGDDPAPATGQTVAEEAPTKKPTPAEAMDAEEAEDEQEFADANEKDLPLATRAALMKWETPPHLKDRLGKELGRGEKLVWTGKPSVLLVILNGLILPAGAMLLAVLLVVGVADLVCWLTGLPLILKFGVLPFLYLYLFWGFLVRPLWQWFTAARTDYVLTNRRAILWRPSFLGIVMKEEYRPDELVFMRCSRAWFFGGQNAGSVIFRTVITRTTKTDNRGNTSTSSTTTHYGFLDIMNAPAVEQLIGVILLASLKQDGKGYKVSGGIVADCEKLRAEHAAAEETRGRERRWILLGGVAGAAALFLVCSGGVVNAFLTAGRKEPGAQANQQGGDGKPQKNTLPALSPVDQALLDLKSENHDARLKAADILKDQKVLDSRKEEVSGALETALRESNPPFEPEHHINALKKWATPDCANTLIEEVKEGKKGVRVGAIEILGNLKVAKAADLLADRLVDRNDRAAAEKALLALGAPAEQPVLKYANHPDRGVQDAARRVLKALGTADSTLLPQLVTDLKSENAATRNAAVVSLGRIKTADPKFQTEVSGGLAELLAKADSKGKEPIVQALGTWATKDAVPAMSAALEDRSDKVRDSVLDTLARLKDPRCADAVAKFLEDRKYRPRASALLIALGQPAETAVVKQLDSRDKDTKVAACKVLKEIGTNQSADALQKLTADKDRNIKAAADEALKEAVKRN